MDFKHNLLSPNDHILTAVSGGADSVALLYSILELKEKLLLTVSVCHINHNLRGEESDKDAKFVENLCDMLSLPFFYYSEDVKAKQGNLTLEEAARNIRYSLLYKAAKKCEANKIALGHNKNDNAETIILRLCRGTGLKGLCGIPHTRKGQNNTTIIRPLIEADRTSIESYLNEKGIPYRTDISNFDTTFYRNRIRQDLIPIMQQINPQVINQIVKNSQLLQEDEDLLEVLTTEAIENCTIEENTLAIPNLLKLPRSLQKRVIRSTILKINGLRDISYDHITQIESLLYSQTGKVVHLPGNLRVAREYDRLNIYFKDQTNLNPTGFCHDITLNTPVFIPSMGYHVHAYLKNSFVNSSNNASKICTKDFNYDRIKEADVKSLQLRTRCPGDKIVLPGGTKKIKNEFIDRKLPKAKRDTIPLLAIGKDILWVVDPNNQTSKCVSHAYLPINGCEVLTVEVLKYEGIG